MLRPTNVQVGDGNNNQQGDENNSQQGDENNNQLGWNSYNSSKVVCKALEEIGEHRKLLEYAYKQMSDVVTYLINKQK